ncbi:MAG: hypothetical protein H6579_03085 [Chitinophagales bacterium]|nr:hypothetical protein [Chitinophagales bacterium]
MLQLFSRRQSNLAFLIILVCFIPLQAANSFLFKDMDVWHQSAPLANFIYHILGESILQNSWFIFFTSFFLILLHLVIVHNIISKIKNLDKHSVLLTWLYLWLIHLFPEWSTFSPALMATSILLICLYLFYENVEDRSDSFVFNISLLIGVSFLLWYPSILLLAFFAIALFQYNALNIKRIFIIFLSFILPTTNMLAYFFLSDQSEKILYSLGNFHLQELILVQPDLKVIAVIVLTLILTILGLFQALSLAAKTVKFSRLFINNLLSLVIFVLLASFLSTNEFSYSLLALIFPISLYLVLFINIIKRPIYAEIVHISLILMILFNFVYTLQS